MERPWQKKTNKQIIPPLRTYLTFHSSINRNDDNNNHDGDDNDNKKSIPTGEIVSDLKRKSSIKRALRQFICISSFIRLNLIPC